MLLGGLLLAVALPSAAQGQLISPGKLSEPHAHLEGVGNCTQCHQLRTRGADSQRCLECHAPLARRIEERRGYHGSLSEVECGVCHKEHLGKSFRPVHFVPEDFAHDSTGYGLRGSHAEVECKACHQPALVLDAEVLEFKGSAGALERTFLGLGTQCADCHEDDDPHQGQFVDRDCGSCHQEEDWGEADAFDHARSRYPLEGRHGEVECGLCHKVERGGSGEEFRRFRPLDSSDCSVCHEDPHRGGMRGSCTGCHIPDGWGQVHRSRVESAFDHATTRFSLVGAHARADCSACHSARAGTPGIRLVFPSEEVRTKTFPRPRHETCAACHSDEHDGAFPERDCDTCHTLEGWAPAEFDLARHDQESRFALTGAHRVTPCIACHQEAEGVAKRLRFRMEDARDCASCHREEDPHEGAFGDAPCETCHGTEAFLMDSFDHEKPEIRDWVGTCTVCHGERQPHGDQFPERECGACHSTMAFEIPDFDHSSSRFPLDGAHEDVSCGECHRREDAPGSPGGSMVRYRPLELDCVACHGGGE